MLKDKDISHEPRWKPARSRYRLKRPTLYRISLVLGILCTLQFLRLHLLARHSLQAKYTTTLFSGREQELNEYNATSTAFSPLDRLALLAAKPEWQPLGSGWEGSTFKWNGNVVKTFNPERSPFRNCLASSLSHHGMFNDSEELWRAARWPTEIPASVVADAEPGFLPIKDFFLMSSSPEQKAEWHLVMPLMEGGTLQNLAKIVLQSQPEGKASVRGLDIRFRPKFNEVLFALQRLHAKGLCHDDVKADNIFIGASTAEADSPWLLGDLGNVREVSHPYHTSRLWTHSNSQLPDCRANDALRAVKAYLQFLRAASKGTKSTTPTTDFDLALVDARESWAHLLWRADAAGSALHTGQVLKWSAKAEHPGNSIGFVAMPHRNIMADVRAWLLRPFVGWRSVYRRAVTSTLKTSVSEGGTRKLALTWFLGVPVGRC